MNGDFIISEAIEKEMSSFLKKDYRIIFNYFNRFILSEPLKAQKYLDYYFLKKNILSVYKCDHNKPMFIDNLKSLESKSIVLSSKVSIVMGVYNEEKYILNALDSLFSQTYQNIEIIVIDDASTDGTIEKMAHVKEIFKERLKIIRLKENVGTYVARNVGMSYASGDLITFHDADDWAHPQRIEEHVKAHLKNKKIKFSISKLVRMTENGHFYSKHIYPIDRLSMVSLMIDKSLIDEVGYFRIHRLGSDTEYFERLKKFTKYKFKRIDKVLIFCAHRENSLTTSPETGVEGFGKTNKRQHYWNQWHKWHDILKKARRKPFVNFDRNEYDYDII